MIQTGANTIARLISACIRSSLEFSDDPAFDGKDCRYDQGSYDDFSSGHCLLLTVYVCIILSINLDVNQTTITKDEVFVDAAVVGPDTIVARDQVIVLDATPGIVLADYDDFERIQCWIYCVHVCIITPG